MTSFLLWLNTHRIIVILFLGISMWVAAYVWYFWNVIGRRLLRKRQHSWSVDLVSKRRVSRGKEIV